MKRHSIAVMEQNPNQRRWWREIWKSQGFFNWNDAGDWLAGYGATPERTSGGFELVFASEEDLMMFKLAWL